VRQLSGHDAAFLAMETDDVHGHGAGLCLLDTGAAGGPLTLERVVRLLDERLHLAPALRRVLVTVPLSLDQPYWIDGEVDLAYHVREVVLPGDGGERALHELVARLHARHLDRSRPLWELYLVHGLPQGRQALFLKIHHAVIDGVGGNHLLAALFDLDADGRDVERAPAPAVEGRPSTVELLGRTVLSTLRRPGRALGLGYRLARAAPTVLGEPTRRRLPLLDRLRPSASTAGLSDVGLRAPSTPFNGPIGPGRKVTTCSLPLDAVLEVRALLGITVNDVVMAVCAGALRTWLAEASALPAEPLLAAAPISFRSAEAAAAGNQFGLLITVLPTDVADPVARAHAAADAMRGAKRTYGALPPMVLSDLAGLAVPALVSLGAGLSERLHVVERLRPFNVMISNVQGPGGPLYCAGARVEAYFPLSQVVQGQALNITMMSYNRVLHVGLLADGDLPLDLDRLGHLLSNELTRLAGASASPTPPVSAAPG
jgi:diacylglycerol O-acyltransferase